MHKLFCISDVHGFYNEMVEALNIAGFDPKNKNHWLVSCGDHFDRGSQPLEVMRYLMSLPRAVLIRGNHESLFEECCERGYPKAHDFSNGTYSTICKLGGEEYGRSFDECCIVAQAKTELFRNKMVNYFETKNYVFCHSWIPVNCDDGLPAYYRRNRKFFKKEDWRYSHQNEWDDAMWLNPLDMAQNGFGIDKTIVSGHWHCSYGWALEKGLPEFGDGACFEPYHYNDTLIMVDGCVAHSKKVNVLVVEDDFMEDTNDG